jgi:hypothetical protein
VARRELVLGSKEDGEITLAKDEIKRREDQGWDLEEQLSCG